MTEAQAQRALALLANKRLHGTIMPYRKEYAVACQFACFWRIQSFSQWLKAQPSWRERIDLIQAELERLQAQELEAVSHE